MKLRASAAITSICQFKPRQHDAEEAAAGRDGAGRQWVEEANQVQVQLQTDDLAGEFH